MDLQQCPNITDSYLEQLARNSDQNLEIINYYGETIQFVESEKEEGSEASGDESSTTEGALKSDDFSLDLSL